MKMEVKKVDPQGRIVLPVSWRRGKGDEMVVVEMDDKVEIVARDSDLSRYLDSVESSVENFEDYHKMRKELREK